MTITDELLLEWESLAAAATAGPWRADWDFQDITSDNDDYDEYWVIEDKCVSGPNWDFIAAARTAVPALVAEVERLRDTVEEQADLLRAAAEHIDRVETSKPLVEGTVGARHVGKYMHLEGDGIMITVMDGWRLAIGGPAADGKTFVVSIRETK